MSFKNAARAATIAVELAIPALESFGLYEAGKLEASNHEVASKVVLAVSIVLIGRPAGRSACLRWMQQQKFDLS
jgi:hypothetical protein